MAAKAAAPEHVFLIDGSGFLFRAFHALPPMTRPDGTPVNAVYGFTSMLMKLVADTDADHVAVIFDAGRQTFRNDLYADYKANRPEPPEELIPQFSLVRDATRAFNVACVEMPGYEADDLIATYARQAAESGAEVTIVSSDKDLMQLVGGTVSMLDPMKNTPIGPAEVEKKFGVGPDRVVDVQALAGDSTDNVPGVPGIGVKTAAQLIGEYGDLDSLLARAEEIKQPKRRQNLIEHADAARISRELVRLVDDVAVETPITDFKVARPDPEILLAFLREQGFRSIAARVESQFGAGLAKASAPAQADHGPRDYVTVRDAGTLAEWVDAAMAEGWVAVDTETSSLDAMAAALVGVSLALPDGRACYVPLAHVAPAGDQSSLLDDEACSAEAPEQLPFDDAMALLKPMLEDPSVLKVGQNIKYDMLVLSREANGGIVLAPVDDTMVMSYVLEAGSHGHGMDEIARLYLDQQTMSYSDVAGSGRNRIPFAQVAVEDATRYAAEDADITGALWRNLKPRLLEERMTTVYERLERPLIPVLVAMERTGVRVDAAVLKGLSDEFGRRLGDLEAEVHTLAGREFNVGSPKQLGEVLFEDLALPGGKKGKTGAWATPASVLEELAATHDLPARVLDWRQLSKLKGTYTDALQKQINPDTGRVHTSYGMAIASTGRLSSTDPNLQNIPIRTEEGRKIRTAFVADPGHVLLSADYSQIELRLLASVADIDALKQVFRDGQDIHAMTASEVFGVPMTEMDGATRRRAKAINFGIIYGISAFGLARQLGIARGEAQDYIDTYFERFPGIRAYMDRTIKQAREQGWVATPYGRRIHTPAINEKNPARRGFGERAAINAPLQGGAADIIKRAMIRLPGALTDAGLKTRMLLQVHDELVFEVPEAEAEEARALIVSVMEGANDLDVPMVAETGVGPNWDDAH
jgi:DNA polymerase-1